MSRLHFPQFAFSGRTPNEILREKLQWLIEGLSRQVSDITRGRTIDNTQAYSDRIRVRFSDTDAQGHLYFANYLVYADEVAGHYMEDLGYPAVGLEEAPAYIFTVNINCDYIDECKSGDVILVSVAYEKLGRSSAVLAYQLSHDASGKLLAKGSLTQVFADKKTRKSCAIPADFRAAIFQRQPELI
jgi:acyl-CoA thioester hydrolase